jgi:ubiquinone/menaquinone biosynthesis C-methylase UbiE
MDRKDYFSNQSKHYAAFRPAYPQALYSFILRHLDSRSRAWDCATGNGQVAKDLAKHFDIIYATDISQQQIDQTVRVENIHYSVAAAEHSGLESNQFDLITVAQALHWINTDAFYKEVKRTAKRQGLLAIWGYSLLAVDPDVDELFLEFYHHKIGPYWDEGRRLVENHYRDIPFPFEQIPCPDFEIKVEWSAHQFAGYLSSWSATQKYIQAEKTDPVGAFMKNLARVWKEDEIKVATFPVFMKLGKIHTDVITGG